MEGSSHRRCVPEHAVPVPLSIIANAKSDRVEFGKIELVRVQVMGIVDEIKVKEFDMDIFMADQNNENRVMARQVFSSDFPPEVAEQLQVGHKIEVYGKLRVSEGEEPYLNSLALHIVTDPQFKTFQTMCRVSKLFFEMNTPALPSGTKCKVPEKKGLSKRLGNLDRFPMSFLEKSTSIENNGGHWPAEIEELATSGSSSRDRKRKRDSSSDEEEDDASDAGEAGMKTGGEEDANEEELETGAALVDSDEAEPSESNEVDQGE